MFFTGQTRDASHILTEQQANLSLQAPVLNALRDIAIEARREVAAGNLDSLGRLLDEGWTLKRRLASKISNGSIDALYETAQRAGALGGKITGAGGGGFLLLYCANGQRQSVREALRGLRELPFRFEPDGSKVIFDYRR